MNILHIGTLNIYDWKIIYICETENMKFLNRCDFKLLRLLQLLICREIGYTSETY